MTTRALGLLAVLLLALSGACSGGGGDDGTDAGGDGTTTVELVPSDDQGEAEVEVSAAGPCAALQDLEDPFAFGEVISAAREVYEAEVDLADEQAQGGSFANAGCTDEGLRLQHQAPDGAQSLLIFEWDGDTPIYVEELEPAEACELSDLDLSLQEVLGC